MEQILSDIKKLKNKLFEENINIEEITNIEEKISNLIGKEMEVKDFRKILINMGQRLYEIEERVEEEINEELAGEVFKIRRKVMRLKMGIDYIHGF